MTAAALLVLSIACAGAARAAPPSPSETLQQAALAYRDGRQAEALQKYLAFIAEAPQAAEAPQTQEALKKVWEIARDLKKEEDEIALNPARWKQVVSAARRSMEERRDAAGRLLREFGDLARNLPASKNPLGVLRAARLEDVVSLDPAGMDDWAKWRLEQHLAAIRQALGQIAASASPSLAELYEVRGYYWLYQGDMELAVQQWKKALDLSPQDADLKRRCEWLQTRWSAQKLKDQSRHDFLLGLSNFKAGQYSQAKSRLESAARLDPSNVEAQRYLDMAGRALAEASRQSRIQDLMIEGRTRQEAGRILDAVAVWVDVLALDPANDEARRSLNRIRRRLVFQAPPANAPPAADASPAGGRGARPSASTAPSREAAERAQEAYSLGLIHYSDGDLPSAQQAFEEALRLDPSMKKARQGLDQVLAERSR